MASIDFEFPDAGLSGKATSFTEATFYTYLDDLLRNADDANDGLLARAVFEPAYEEIEKARQGFPRLAASVADLLCQDAGLSREVAPLEDELNAETPPNVLRRAGLPAEVGAGLVSDAAAGGYRLKLVTVRAPDRSTLFACVLRSPEDAALITMRDAREKKKGYGRAARGAALASVVWASSRIEDTCTRYPAIPSLVLAPILIEMGDRSAEARFRRR